MSDIESKITNVSGFDHLDITIKAGDVIKTRSGCQIVLDRNLKIVANVGGKGIMSGIWRSVSTGTFFINNVSYDNDYIDESVGYEKKGVLSIFSIFPGNIKEITILPNEKWCVHSNSFLASTSNIDITSGASFKGLIGGQSLFYTKIENNTNSNGKIWLISYGGIIEKPLKTNRKFLIHEGLCLAKKEKV